MATPMVVAVVVTLEHNHTIILLGEPCNIEISHSGSSCHAKTNHNRIEEILYSFHSFVE